jgi:F-type H+-transporting ATPase subunit b
MQLSAILGVLLSGGSIIDLDGTVFVQIGLFFLAFFVLRGLVFKPMLAVLDAREEAIDGAKEHAKRLDIEVKEKQASFEAELRKVRSASSEERDRLRAEAMEIERNLLEKVRVETQRVITESKQRVDAEAQLARQTLAAQRPELAREIASKVLGREVQG